ncbi:MAG: chromosome segregation protein SMC [Bdellovibrionales bacterium]|nr:chromosome segregation protein SMC [Bdellovibrionales bacterium]
MRIKKLELVGFKSFKDRTVVHFDAGITGIVGPNGCGKSNIVDALQWVMGEMSAKHLRGTSMNDVIFGGADGYAPSGMAEVSMVLENDGGPFPAQYANFSEIQVTRRLHRSGDSEYLINKEPARLRDIHEIFMDTGAGSKGFSIIEQGAIGKIVVAKPEDRRVLIEEAAGITKFKARKRESQRKLQATEQNLIRIGDIVTELKRQIESLQRQAKKAARYRELRKEAQELDLMISSKDYAKFREAAITARHTIENGDLSVQTIKTQMSELEGQNQTERLQQLELEKRLEGQQIEFAALNEQVREKEKRIQELHFEVEQAKRQAVMQGDLRAEAETRREMLEREVNSLRESYESTYAEAQRLEAEFKELNERYQHVQKRLSEGDAEITAARRELVLNEQAKGQFQVQLESSKVRMEEVESRIQDSQVILEDLNGKKIEFDSERKRTYEALEKERQMQLEIMHDVENFEENRKTLDADVKNRREEVEQYKDKLNEVVSRLYGLENLHSNFEGFQAGVKSVMLWRRQQVETAQGTSEEMVAQMLPMADVVEVSKDYELAMEAALGNRLQLILSNNQDDVLKAVDYLKESKAGRSSFFSGDRRGGESVGQAPTGEGVDILLKDVVKAPENFQEAVAYMLKDVVVVDSVRTALRLRGDYPGWTFVTRDGDTLSADGVLTGGTPESADSGVLKRRREIKELSEAKEEWAGKLALSQATLKKQEERLESLAADLETAMKQRAEREIKVAELKKDLERADRELNNLQSALDRQNSDVNRLMDQKSEQESKIQGLETEIETFIGKRLELENRVQALDKELEDYKSGVEGMRERVTQLRGDSASKTQEAEGRKRQLEMMDAQLSDVNARIARMSEEVEQTSTSMSENQIQLEEEKVALERMIGQVQNVQGELSRVKDEYEKLGMALRGVDEQLLNLRRQQNEHEGSLNEARLTLEKSELRMASLEEHIQERYMTELSAVVDQYKDREANIEESQAMLDDLRGRLQRMGEVNLAAVEEYDEISQRYEFLNQQQQDLINAKEQLKKVIDRINRICNKRFKETFTSVNERFKTVFPVLFGGGEAHLTLIENHESGEMGIDITAKPPGKKPQSVTLLSGGEKALTAVSLIFSIFLVKPSPYCLLDEVDAPLDDANVYRFNDLVREMAKRSQIIVVTHNKNTMEIAEKLYGVTMQEKGVSKMVSVNIS